MYEQTDSRAEGSSGIPIIIPEESVVCILVRFRSTALVNEVTKAEVGADAPKHPRGEARESRQLASVYIECIVTKAAIG